jgi:hypothetical protein
MGNLTNIFEPRHVWPVFGQQLITKRVDFALHGQPEACTLEAQVESAYP